MNMVIIIFLLTLIILPFHYAYAQPPDRITIGDQELFASGGNIAWINFARDIGSGNTRLDVFEEIFREVNEHGGNMMRIWLHTNGVSTPEWNGNTVVGPGGGAIDDLRDILDLAYFYDVSLKLCLWSFDMLQAGLSSRQIQLNRDLLTDADKLQAYIDNALIPMVDSLKGHPAIAAWEIFNEPEGMTTQYGWTPHRVNMTDVQWFINRTAGAIRRTDPNTFVTNGSWNIRASSDIGTFYNWYKDERLIDTGGDEDGILDFYSVHYYKHFPTSQSPFHHNASHWNLDKPIVIAEFYLSDPRQDGDPDGIYGVNWEDLYETLYEQGYAGALGWQWFDWWANRTNLDGVDGTLSWPRMLVNMETMSTKYPDDVILEFPGLRGRFSAFPEGIEEGGTSTLSWSIRGKPVLVTLNGEPVDPDDSLDVSPHETTTYILFAEDADGNTKEWEVTVTVLDPMQVNRAFQKPVYASSVQDEVAGENLPAHHINNGNLNTRWSSKWQDDEWIFIDLEASFAVHEVVIHWEAAYGESYNIDFSFDGVNWETMYEERNGQGGIDTLAFDPPLDTRFVRMHGLVRATQWGFSIYELEVYGLKSNVQPPKITLVSPDDDDFLETHQPVVIEADVQPGTYDISHIDFYIDDNHVGTSTEDSYVFIWENPEEGNYTLSAVAVDQFFQIHSFPREIHINPELQSIRLEAEAATLSGSTEILNDPDANGGKYVRMQDATGSSLTWNDIEVYQGGLYFLWIRYRLSFDDPKGQHIHVNDEIYEEVMFTGELDTWLTHEMNVELISGINTIKIEGLWGWMDFDYIEIRGDNIVEVNNRDNIAYSFNLKQNYPNPFNPQTTITYGLGTSSHVKLSVYDVMGRQVAILVNEKNQAGQHSVLFNASYLASGVYFYRIETKDFSSILKMLYLK